MSVFHERLSKAIESSAKYAGNRARLSKALGMSPNYISTVLNTKANPNWDVVVRISDELSVSLGYLAGKTAEPFDLSQMSNEGPFTDQALRFFDQIANNLRQAAVLRGQEPTIDDMMGLWYRYAKKESAFESFSTWFDLYRAPGPGANRIEVLAMGRTSLAARTLGRGASPESLQYALDEVPDQELRQRLISAYRRAAIEGPVLSEEYLDVLAPGHAEKIRLDYLRLLLPVERADGSAAIICYSKPLR